MYLREKQYSSIVLDIMSYIQGNNYVQSPNIITSSMNFDLYNIKNKFEKILPLYCKTNERIVKNK